MEEAEAIADVMNILEAEPSSETDHREQLAVLVASGKAKEMTGVDLTQDQVKRLNEKDVERYFRRYETSLSSKTCDAMVDTFLQLSCRLISHFLPVDQSRLLKDLNENFMVKKELSMIAGRLSLNYEKYMALASAALLTAKNVELPKDLDNNMLSEELDKNLENNLEERK